MEYIIDEEELINFIEGKGITFVTDFDIKDFLKSKQPVELMAELKEYSYSRNLLIEEYNEIGQGKCINNIEILNRCKIYIQKEK